MGNFLSHLCSVGTHPNRTITFQNGTKISLGNQLGEGGFSFVYIGKDTETGEKYAVKRMICQTKELFSVAENEIQVFKSLPNHPNILPLLDILNIEKKGEEYPEIYLLLPYIKGGTLQDSMDDQRISVGENSSSPWKPREIVSIFKGICEGVNEFHQQDPPLAVRDLKPPNILLDRTQEIPVGILADFGSVDKANITVNSRKEALQLQDQITSTTTPLYKAPELFNISNESTIGTEIDIWSLGCILYTMLFNKSPFDKESQEGGAVNIGLAALSGNISFPEIDASYSELVELTKKILIVDPLNRPSALGILGLLSDLNL